MKLPTLDTYAFPVTLPSSQQLITMRPYLVREEKLLLMAQESGNPQDQIEATAQLIRNCTNGAVEPRVAPYFDIEYLLLQLRARSVGEVANPTYKCHTKQDDRECGHETTVAINIATIPVTKLDRKPDDFIIKLNEHYHLTLRYPTIYTIGDLALATLTDTRVVGVSTVNALVDMFDVLTNVTTGDVYKFSEFSTADKIEFMDSFAPNDYDKLVDFLGRMPTLTHDVEFTCEKCNTTHKIHLEGLVDFLA